MNRDREVRVFAVFGDTHDYDYGSQAGLAVFATLEDAERVVDELERAETRAARKEILPGAEDFINFASYEVPAFGLALPPAGGVEEDEGVQLLLADLRKGRDRRAVGDPVRTEFEYHIETVLRLAALSPTTPQGEES